MDDSYGQSMSELMHERCKQIQLWRSVIGTAYNDFNSGKKYLVEEVSTWICKNGKITEDFKEVCDMANLDSNDVFNAFYNKSVDINNLIKLKK